MAQRDRWRGGSGHLFQGRDVESVTVNPGKERNSRINPEEGPRGLLGNHDSGEEIRVTTRHRPRPDRYCDPVLGQILGAGDQPLPIVGEPEVLVVGTAELERSEESAGGE